MKTGTRDYFSGRQLDGADDVLEALELLERDLPLMKMGELRSFNYTYVIITRNVRQAAAQGQFEYREFLDRFDGRFAVYYTESLRRYFEKREVAPAWHLAFEHAEEGSRTPLVLMALGVNAHVNNDIPQVLRDCDAQEKYFNDFLLINDIIGASLEEVIDELDEAGNLGDPKKKLLRPVYETSMKQLVRTWRHSAWDKFNMLKAQRIAVKDVEQIAQRTAGQILALPV